MQQERGYNEEAREAEAARLVGRVQHGDRRAFASLYELYFGPVYAYLKILLSDPHQAEDATQDVFIKVLRGLPEYESNGRPFRTWLFTIVKNHALDHLAKQGRISAEEPDRVERRRERAGDVEGDLTVLNWITDSDLMLFIERLPLSQRQVLVLRYLLDLTTAQAASVLGRTAGEVRMLQHRALTFLRLRLAAIGRAPLPGRRDPVERMRQRAPVLRARRWALK